jgi:hypothetical protein
MARKEKTIHYLYKTTCNVTERYYVGIHSTNNLDDGYMGSGKRLRRSIRKYGIENHTKEILEFFESRETLIEAEKKAITSEMITDKNCMNLMGGGTGGFISEEQQKHRSICANKVLNEKLKNDIEFKEKWLDSVKKGVQKAIDDGKMKTWKDTYNWSGKTHTEETKEKISKKMREIGNSQLNTCWVSKDEIKRKISINELDNYISNGWVKGKISNIKEIIDFYLKVKSFGKTSKHFKINKRTLIDNIRLNE